MATITLLDVINHPEAVIAVIVVVWIMFMEIGYQVSRRRKR